MKHHQRAIRRRALALKKRRILHYQKHKWSAETPPKRHPSLRGIFARTPTTCSCHGCGNPRRHHAKLPDRLTRAERRSLLDLKDQNPDEILFWLHWDELQARRQQQREHSL